MIKSTNISVDAIQPGEVKETVNSIVEDGPIEIEEGWKKGGSGKQRNVMKFVEGKSKKAISVLDGGDIDQAIELFQTIVTNLKSFKARM